MVSGLVKGLAWKEPVVYWWLPDMLARHLFCWFCYIQYQSLRNQHIPVISCLDSNRGLPPFLNSIYYPPTPYPSPLSEHSWCYFTSPTAQIFYLVWWETLQAATSTGSAWSKVVYWCILCVNFIRMLAYADLNSLKQYLETSNVHLDRFSKIQSHHTSWALWLTIPKSAVQLEMKPCREVTTNHEY